MRTLYRILVKLYIASRLLRVSKDVGDKKLRQRLEKCGYVWDNESACATSR